MNLEQALGLHGSSSNWPPSLVDAPVGKRVRVGRIVFKLVRSLCDDLDLSPGDRIQVEERSDGTVTVRNREGRSVDLPVHFAHFILIYPSDSPGP